MIWSPISRARPAWDIVFIVDFTLTALLLVPQFAAWVHRDTARNVLRASRMWALFTVLALGSSLVRVRSRISVLRMGRSHRQHNFRRNIFPAAHRKSRRENSAAPLGRATDCSPPPHICCSALTRITSRSLMCAISPPRKKLKRRISPRFLSRHPFSIGKD